MKLSRGVAFTAMLGACTFFAHSLLNLLAFAAHTRAIAPEMIQEPFKHYLATLFAHFNQISTTLTTIESLAGVCIAYAFFQIAKKRKKPLLKIAALFLVLAALLPTAQMLLSLPMSDKMMNVTSGVIMLFFGIIYISKKSLDETIIKALGMLFFLEGIILCSTYGIPLRIADFTIAINILEAVFFYKLEK